MAKYCLCLAAFLALTLGMGSRLPAQTGGTLLGQVHDSSGLGVAGAQLIVAPTQVVTTDSGGRFTLVDVPSGPHDIHVTAIGYYSMIFPAVEFQARDTVRLAVEVVRRSVRIRECMVAHECQPRP